MKLAVKIKLNESAKAEGLEISFTNYIERMSTEEKFSYTIFDLTLKTGGKSKDIKFKVDASSGRPVERWEGYRITFLDGFRGEIELKVEKE